MHRIPETDWKRLRDLRDLALDRICRRILGEVGALIDDGERTAHDRYRALFRLLRERDEDVALAFDDPRRSNALIQLTCMRRLGLVHDDEMARFSEPTRQAVESFLSLGQSRRGSHETAREPRS